MKTSMTHNNYLIFWSEIEQSLRSKIQSSEF